MSSQRRSRRRLLTWPERPARPILSSGGSLLYVLVNETKGIIHIVRTSRERFYKSIVDNYFGIWIAVDWVSIGVAIVVLMCFVTLQLELSGVNQASRVLTATGSNVGRDTHVKMISYFFAKVDVMCSHKPNFRLTLCLYPMIVMLWLLKSFTAQPRLAVVTATLTTAEQDRGHFFIVFTSVYICVAVNRVPLFEQDRVDLPTFNRSFHTCFRAMFGDWNQDAMQEVGRILTGGWFWTFMSVMVVILLNMLLAILMDAHTEVKQNAGNASPCSGRSAR